MDNFPLVAESQFRLQPISFERNRFLSKTAAPEIQTQQIQEGVAQSQLESNRVAQDLIARKQEAENQRQFQEKQLQLDKDRIAQSKKEAQMQGMVAAAGIGAGVGFGASALGMGVAGASGVGAGVAAVILGAELLKD